MGLKINLFRIGRNPEVDQNKVFIDVQTGDSRGNVTYEITSLEALEALGFSRNDVETRFNQDVDIFKGQNIQFGPGEAFRVGDNGLSSLGSFVPGGTLSLDPKWKNILTTPNIPLTISGSKINLGDVESMAEFEKQFKALQTQGLSPAEIYQRLAPIQPERPDTTFQTSVQTPSGQTEPSSSQTRQTPTQDPSGQSTSQATLSSPDGKFKTVVTVGSSEASKLQSQGWILGASGKTVIDTQTALSNLSSTTVPQGTTQQTVNNTGQGIGNAVVDSLFQLYLGRPANEQEKALYSSQADDTVLRKNLEQTRTQILEKSQRDFEQAPTANYIIDGNYVLVKFQEDPTPSDNIDDKNTIWFYDKQNKTYRPFASTAAMESFFETTIDKIMPLVQSVPVTALSNITWQGDFLTRDRAVQNNGEIPGGEDKVVNETVKQTPQQPSPETMQALQNIYGAEKLSSEDEQWVTNLIGTVLTTAKLKDDISQDVFDKTVGNATELAKYTSAVLYGGYTLGDIYKEIKAKQLSANGNSEYDNFKAFDENVKASSWYSTSDGIKAKNDTLLIIPLDILNMDSSLFDNPIFQIPGQAFTTLIEPIDWTSPEFQAEAEKIQASYYDLMMQKAEAQTEQAKALAENNWNEFKTSLEKKYGLALSDNARTAWGQLQDMFSGYSQAGLGDSGLMNEAMDRYLADVRRNNQLLRDEKLTTEESNYKNYLLNSATSEEIKQFVAQNPDKAKAYGLIPSDDVANWFNIDNLKKLYPTLSDAQIKAMRDTMLDENGNYRSQLYQNLFANKYDLGEAKKTYQQEKLMAQKLTEEEKAYAPYTAAANPFSSYNPDYASLPDDITQPETTTTGTDTTVPSGTSSPQSRDVQGMEGKATLYGPGGQREVVEIGTSRASQLQSQGWTLTPAATEFAILYGPSGSSKRVQVGSSEASQLLGSGWSLTPAIPSSSPTSLASASEAASNISNQWSAPSGYSAIPNPSEIERYSAHMTNPDGTTMYGKPLVRIPGLTELKLYKPEETKKVGADQRV